MNRALFTIVFVFCCISVAAATAKSIPEMTTGMKKHPGFFSFYWDSTAGKIWLEIDSWDQEFLYVDSLPGGIGSNDIGLDRGQLGESRVVKFYRSGPRVLLVQSNYSYRALSQDPAERQAIEESFAQSVLWGFNVEAGDNTRVLVDATEFFMHDAHNISMVLKNTKQGSYKLEPSRSAIFLPRTRNFPDNTELESILTFVTADEPGEYVQRTVPNPQSITVRQHHSFVRLPDGGYQPREFDPRCGFFGISFLDYATPVAEPIQKRWISRHRLQKKDPTAPISDPVKPIVYHVDPGAPEPIRSALIEGAQWWNQAFEAAGYRNAFQVKLLPPDADPMDVRYNTIQWVHRSTRGWSYGGGVIDPRTGEIIKGHVILGSLRVRQDFLIAEGLLSPYEEGKPASPEMLEMALARIRQLSAHEVGHTLGLSHNYIASTMDRASVMDYPHPLVQIRADGSFDLSRAYGAGIGEWDKVAIAYGYQDFPGSVDSREKLNAILMDAMSRGLIFLSDQDARPAGSAHPKAHLWDNGADAVDELSHILEVRRQALSRFSEKNIRKVSPLATLEEVLVPIYLFHRYQVDAVSKAIGGVYYTYALRGDGQMPLEIVSPEEQRRALEALVLTLSPEVLALPETVLKLIPPHPSGYERTRELFQSRTGPTLDPLGAAETAAAMTVEKILHRERAARLVEFHARDARYPGFEEVADRVIAATWKAPRGPGLHAEIRRGVDAVVLSGLMALAADQKASTTVRALATAQIESLGSWLTQQMAVADSKQKAHVLYALSQIKRFQEDPEDVALSTSPEAPAGPPIGSCGW